MGVGEMALTLSQGGYFALAYSKPRGYFTLAYARPRGILYTSLCQAKGDTSH